MNKTWTSTFLFKIAFGVFVVLLTLINYQALASEKEQNSEFSNPFLPLYPNDSDYQAFNQEIAQRMGIDLDNSCPLKIAVIDSGIDAGADGLQGKIDIYRNYTADGAVKLQKVSKSLGAGLYLDNRRYGLPKTAEEAKYYCGIYDLSAYPYLESTGEYAVLLVRTADGAMVYVDTDGDLDFGDEKEIGLYNETKEYVSLATAKGRINLALTAISEDNESLQLSSDYLGHGTFIAGLIGAESEEYQGLAKDSRLLIYQIFTQEGQASQENLAKGINAALADGADIINLSLSLPLNLEPGANLLQALENARLQKVPVVAAGGNYGTNNDSISYPAKAEGVLAVGALITKEGYSRGRGINLPEDFIPSYSPRAAEYTDFVLAPACAVSIVPQWFGEKYMFDEGTSVAAAAATACAAHTLAQGAERENFAVNFAKAAQSLGYDWCRQGNGLVQAQWTAASEAQIELYQEDGYIRLENKDDEVREVYLTSDQAWLEVPYKVVVEAKSTNYLPVNVKLSSKGSYTALVRTKVGENRLNSTALLYKIERVDNLAETLKAQFDLKAGEVWDYYWQAEKDREMEIKVSLEKLSWDDKSLPHGRIMVEICAPDGQIVQRSEYFGISFGEEKESEKTFTLNSAAKGLWRISIISSESLPLYNQLESYGWVEISKK